MNNIIDYALAPNSLGKVETAKLRASIEAISNILVPKSVFDENLKIVASHCRAPEVWNTVRQLFGHSYHRAGQDLTEFAVEFANYATNSELVKASSLQVFTAVEYPIGSGQMQVMSWADGMFGAIPSGHVARSKFIELVATIPKGEWFRLWHWHSTFNNSDGIPSCKGLPSVKYGTQKGLTVIGGGSYPQINYILSKKKDFLDTLTNSAADDMICPLAIIAKPKANRTLAWGIIGDSRSAGTNAPPNSANVLNGIAERIFCGDAEPFVNLAMSSESYYNDFTAQYFNKRFMQLRYVDKIVNALGTNDSSRYTSDSVTRDLELQLLANPWFAGKKLYAVTVPYQTTSTDYFTTLAGQTGSGTNSNYDYLNNYRLANADGLYYQVLDACAVVCDKTAKKWKVNPLAKSIVATMNTSGSNAVTFPNNDLTAEYDGSYVVMAGIGASNAAVAGILSRTNSGAGLLMGVNSIMESTGLAQNPTTLVTAGTMYLKAREYTKDGIHDSSFAADLMASVLRPTLLA